MYLIPRSTEVLLGLDLKRAGMEQILIQFARKARISDTALVFHAGHGCNTLAPIILRPLTLRLKTRPTCASSSISKM